MKLKEFIVNEAILADLAREPTATPPFANWSPGCPRPVWVSADVVDEIVDALVQA